MDRETIFFGEVPLETHLLKAQQDAMVGLAKLTAAVLGTPTAVNGFTCTPTTPASLNVLLNAGEIYQIANLEATIWSSVQPDSHSIVKQGLLLDPLTFGITPPITFGFSQAFLVEVQYADSDTGLITLPYFNTTPPTVSGGILIPPLPFSGPGNVGTAQNTVRKGIAAAQVKAGIAATTGTQVTPTPDAGWTGIFVVTVANGAATITSGNIVKYIGAPFIPVTLPNVPAGVQQALWVFGVDTGTASNIVVNQTPAPAAYTRGMWLVTIAAAAPTGPTLVNLNGLGNVSVTNTDGTAIAQNQWQAGSILSMFFDATKFQVTSFMRQPGAPVFLQTARTFFVNSTTGSDTLYDGTTATVSGIHGPWATLQKAANSMPQYNLNGFNITINVADSGANPYSFVSWPIVNGSGQIIILGNVANPQNVVVNTPNGQGNVCMNFVTGSYYIAGFFPSAAGTNNFDCIACTGGGCSVTMGSMRFGAAGRAHIFVQAGANFTYDTLVTCTDTMASGANCTSHILAVSGGTVGEAIPPGPGGFPNLTLLGACSMSGGFIQVTSAASTNFTYNVITGYANGTGPHSIVTTNGIINVNGAGATYFPGTSTVAPTTGGQYI